jgi:hypothetical protein
LEEPIIKGIIYSKFHEKLGPMATVWIPDALSEKEKYDTHSKRNTAHQNIDFFCALERDGHA